MFVCRLAIEIGFDFSIFELNINVQERNRSCRSFTSELNSRVDVVEVCDEVV